MKKKMKIEGVGGKIVILTVIYIIIAVILNDKFPSLFTLVDNVGSLNWLIYLLLAIGILFWIPSAIMILLYFPKGKLITGGPFRIFLHPIYESFVFFILPALAIYLNSWLYFGASVVMLIATIVLAKDEEKFLMDTFGEEYSQYRRKVWFKI